MSKESTNEQVFGQVNEIYIIHDDTINYFLFCINSEVAKLLNTQLSRGLFSLTGAGVLVRCKGVALHINASQSLLLLQAHLLTGAQFYRSIISVQGQIQRWEINNSQPPSIIQLLSHI